MKDMRNANAVFDGIAQMKREAEVNSPEDFEFFVSTGDNLYPIVEDKPT